MDKKRLLGLLKNESNKVDAIVMILSNYTDYVHTENGGMVSVAQFKNVADCILEWSGGECSNENSGLNIPVVKPCFSDVEITDKAIEYAKELEIRDKPIETAKIQGYAVRDFYAGYKAALNNTLP